MGEARVAVEVAAGEGLVRRSLWARRRVAGSRDPVIGICLLAVAFGAAFGVRAATGTHAGSPVNATVVGGVVQAPVSVVTTNQIQPAPPLELPKLSRHLAHLAAPHHPAVVHVTTTAAATAPVTQSSGTPATSNQTSSGNPSVASGSTGVAGSGTGDGSVSAPTTPAPTLSDTHSSGTGTSGGSSSGTSSGGGGSTNSGTVSGGGSSNSGTVSGGG